MRRKIDTILLAVALFCISGAVLAYNITTADGEIAVSLSELAEYNRERESMLSVYSENAINNNLSKASQPDGSTTDAVVNVAANSGMKRSYELLDPIVKKPSE